MPSKQQEKETIKQKSKRKSVNVNACISYDFYFSLHILVTYRVNSNCMSQTKP